MEQNPWLKKKDAIEFYSKLAKVNQGNKVNEQYLIQWVVEYILKEGGEKEALSIIQKSSHEY